MHHQEEEDKGHKASPCCESVLEGLGCLISPPDHTGICKVLSPRDVNPGLALPSTSIVPGVHTRETAAVFSGGREARKPAVQGFAFPTSFLSQSHRPQIHSS